MSIASAYWNASEARNSGVTPSGMQQTARPRRDTRLLRQMRGSVSLLGLAATTFLASQPAYAQVAPPTNLVSACSGVSLPRSVVTDIMTPVITGIVTPVEGTVNPILGVVGAIIPLVPALNINASGLLANAASGAPITLQVLNTNGTIVGPGIAAIRRRMASRCARPPASRSAATGSPGSARPGWRRLQARRTRSRSVTRR